MLATIDLRGRLTGGADDAVIDYRTVVPRAAVDVEAALGVVRGVSLSGFLQMMEWEEKSLCIRAEAGRSWGRLHLLQGRLVQAYSHATGMTGEDAALDILSWENVSLRIERSYHNRSGGGTAGKAWGMRWRATTSHPEVEHW